MQCKMDFVHWFLPKESIYVYNLVLSWYELDNGLFDGDEIWLMYDRKTRRATVYLEVLNCCVFCVVFNCCWLLVIYSHCHLELTRMEVAWWHCSSLLDSLLSCMRVLGVMLGMYWLCSYTQLMLFKEQL